jgi:hypothetical protein
MRLRYAGVCWSCAVPLPVGSQAVYYRRERRVACLSCTDNANGDTIGNNADFDEGVAGSSARREHERRSVKREQRIREAHPHLGGLIIALSDDPQSTRAWARGAVGEEKLAKSLVPLTERGVRFLHDRRIPRSRANIDHIVIAPAGVFVIDAKRYKGRPTLRITGGLVRPRVERLLVAGRDCSKLVTGVLKQIQIIRTALGAHGDVPVFGMLCFIDADWPLIGGSLSTQNVRVLWPRKIADHIFEPSVMDKATIATVHGDLARAFPTA